MTFQELLGKLRDEEETILIDLLNLRSTDIVDAFLDQIEQRYDYLSEQYEEKN